MVQLQEQLRCDARQHEAVLANKIEGILARVYAFRPSVEPHAAKPRIGGFVVVQDSPTLLDAEYLRCGEAHALELTGDVHAAREASRAVPHGKRLKLVSADPVLVTPRNPERPRVQDGLRDAYIGAPRDVDTARSVPLHG